MTARRPPAGAIVYVVLCAGAVCYIGGLVSALYRQQAWMAAALGTAIALLAGVTGTLVIDYWVSRKRERRLVRGIEEWMRERPGTVTADGETDTARRRRRESRSGTFRGWRRSRPCRDGLLVPPAVLGGTLSLAGSPAGPGPAPRRKPGHGRGPGYRMLAAGGILPCALLCSTPGSPPAASPGSSPSSPAPAAAGKGGVLPPALPSPAAAKNTPGQAAGHAAGGRPGQENAPVRQVQPPPGLVAPSAMSVLTARSSTLARLNLAGVTTLPVNGGGSEKALKFTASSARLTTVGITIRQSGHTVLTTTASLDMSGGMTLYTTKLCGQVEGTAPDVCFTPDTASQAALKLASALGREVPVTMTDVTADQFLDIAPDARWGPLAMNAA